MAFDTYTGLTDNVALWADNDQLTDSIADFVALAEKQLQRDLKMRFTLTTTTGTLTAAQDYLTLPAGCIEPVALTIMVGSVDCTVDIVAPSEFTRRKNSSLATDVPLVAMSRGLTMALSPAPADAYPYVLQAWHGITPLSVSNPTNWLLENGPDALLYGALVQAGLFMGNDERLQGWTLAYTDAKNSCARLEFRARTGGGPLRMRSDGPTP